MEMYRFYMAKVRLFFQKKVLGRTSKEDGSEIEN